MKGARVLRAARAALRGRQHCSMKLGDLVR